MIPLMPPVALLEFGGREVEDDGLFLLGEELGLAGKSCQKTVDPVGLGVTKFTGKPDAALVDEGAPGTALGSAGEFLP